MAPPVRPSCSATSDANAASTEVNADVVFLDMGSNLGAINRSALLASDHLVVPFAADLFALQALRNLGPTVREWRRAWQGVGLSKVPASIDAPEGASYRSLVPLAQDARKPMFDLRAGDGALGSTGRLVQTCFREFEDLATLLMAAASIAAPVAG